MFVKRLLLATMIAMLCISATQLHAQGTDALSVVTRFISAINAHDSDGVMALIADNAQFHFPGQGGPGLNGKAEVGAWLQDQIAQNIHVGVENLRVTGDSATFTSLLSLDVFRDMGVAPLDGATTILVQNGKITSFTFAMSQASLEKLQRLQVMPQTGSTEPVHVWLLLIVGLGLIGLGLALSMLRSPARRRIGANR